MLLGNKEKPVVEFLPVKSLGDNIKETVPRNKIKQLATKPTYKPTDVADLMANNKEIEQLVKMAEATMGKILTQNDTQAIVSFYDWMGLPADVITMLLSYYKDKPMGYIEKVAIDWSEKEIDTIEKVDKYMSRHKDYSKIMGPRRCRQKTYGKSSLYILPFRVSAIVWLAIQKPFHLFHPGRSFHCSPPQKVLSYLSTPL